MGRANCRMSLRVRPALNPYLTIFGSNPYTFLRNPDNEENPPPHNYRGRIRPAPSPRGTRRLRLAARSPAPLRPQTHVHVPPNGLPARALHALPNKKGFPMSRRPLLNQPTRIEIRLDSKTKKRLTDLATSLGQDLSTLIRGLCLARLLPPGPKSTPASDSTPHSRRPRAS